MDEGWPEETRGREEPTKFLGKSKHLLAGRAADVRVVNCEIREKGLAGLIEF